MKVHAVLEPPMSLESFAENIKSSQYSMLETETVHYNFLELF